MLEVCKQTGGSIISADSRQIVKYMDYGTGKLPIDLAQASDIHKNDGKWTIQGVDIYGYDLITPEQFFSAYDFAKYALETAAKLLSQHKQVYIVGGTGFYIDLLTGRVIPANVEPNFELRKLLNGMSVVELATKLEDLSKDTAKKTDLSNKPRLVRALEILLAQKVTNKAKLPYLTDVNFTYLGLTGPNELLFSRADIWLESIWDNLLAEISDLRARGYGNSHRLQGLVYKSALSGEKERAKFDLHAYIRRQKTYFNKNADIQWFDISRKDWREDAKAHIIA